MNKDYLNDIPTDKEWLEYRKTQWLGQGNKKGLSPTEIQGPRYRLFKYQDDPKTEIEAYEKYFLFGDVEAFTQESERVKFEDIIFLSPVQSFDSLQYVISQAVNWFLSDSKNPLNISEESRREFLTETFHRCISPPLGQYLPDEVSLGMFFWLFGETFQESRRIQLTEDGNPYSIELSVDIDRICQTLLMGIHDHIWSQCEKGNTDRYSNLIDYFLSIYPHYNSQFFSKEIPARSEFKIGGKINPGHYILPRYLIASLNNIITEYDIDDDYEELDSLIINDYEALKQLEKGMEKLKMPGSYYELEQFVLVHGSNCLEA